MKKKADPLTSWTVFALVLVHLVGIAAAPSFVSRRIGLPTIGMIIQGWSPHGMSIIQDWGTQQPAWHECHFTPGRDNPYDRNDTAREIRASQCFERT